MALSTVKHVSRPEARDDLFAPPYLQIFDVGSFCHALHALADPCQYGLSTVQYWKGNFNDYHFLVFDVVPLVPGTDVPQADASHAYFTLGRIIRDSSRALPFQLWGKAEDEVQIVGRKEEYTKSYGTQGLGGFFRLSVLSWTRELPILVDVFDTIRFLSLTFPRYNCFTRDSAWLSQCICRTLLHTYHPRQLIYENNFAWTFGRPTPALISFARDKREWRHLAMERQVHHN